MAGERQERPEDAHMAVWIDQDLDIGSGLAVEICPDVFMLSLEDGLTYTHKNGGILGGFMNGIVTVEPVNEPHVIEAAEEDPGENIFVEYVQTDDSGEINRIWNTETGAWEDWTPERPTGSSDE